MEKTLKKSVLIYSAAIVLELIILILVARHTGWSLNPYLTGFDTIEYSTIAKNLVAHHSFSKSLTPPLVPNFFRSPGYPFWLAFIYWIFGTLKPAIFLGMAAFALSAPLVYLIMRKIFSEKLAFWAGMIFALEPRMAFSAPFILSEQIFMPLFLLSVFFAAGFLSGGKKKFVLLSAVFLSLSALVRGISLYLWPLFLIFFLIKTYKKWPVRKILKVFGAATAVFILIFSPWLVRNRLTLGTWQSSSLFGVQLYWGHLEALEIYLGTPQELAHQKLMNLANHLVGDNFETPRAISILTKEAMKEIRSNLFSSIKVYIFNSALFFITDGYKGMASYIVNIKPNYINFSSLIIHFKFKEIIDSMKSFSLLEVIIPILGRVFWIILTILSFFGVFSSVKNVRQQRLVLVLFILLILYFSIMSGSVVAIDPRFRFPVNGFLIAFALVPIFKMMKLKYNYE